MSDHSSSPPASAAVPRRATRKSNSGPPSAEWGTLQSGNLKAYQDDALLERVRIRLDAKAHRQAPSRKGWQLAAALVVFGLGVFVGRGLPEIASPTTRGPELTRATAETRTGTAATSRQRTPERREARARPAEQIGRKRHAPARAVSPAAPEALSLHSGDQSSIDLGSQAPIALPVATEVLGPSPRSSWLELADRGDYAGALGELERSQVAHVVLATGSVEELMTMAEVARFAGSPERAIQALSQVVDRYQGDPDAPLAAMMLGNLLSRSGDAAGAARAFALNRTLSPGGDFAEDALVREFDLALSAENASLASGLFDQYAREFPAGPHLYAMRYELDELHELLAKVQEAAAVSEALPAPGSERSDDDDADPAAPPAHDQD